MGIYGYFYFYTPPIDSKNTVVASIESASSPILEKEIFNQQNLQLKDQEDFTLRFESSGYIIRFSGPMNLKFISSSPENKESPLLLYISGFNDLEIITSGDPQLLRLYYQDDQWSPEEFNQNKNRVHTLTLKTRGTDQPPLSETPQNETQKSAPPPPKPPTDYNSRIRNLVVEQQDTIKRCHLNRLKDVGILQGKVIVGVIILPSGEVKESRILNSNIEDEPLLSCIKEIFQRLRFPPHKENGEIYRSFPIEFE